MGCIKLNILDEQYKKTEIKVSYRREKLTSNFCGVDAGKYLLHGQVISEYRQDWKLDTIPRYLFSGKEVDAESGMSYFEARYFDPSHMIFISPDPMFEKYFWVSRYAYCSNNPINRIDPTGKEDYEMDIKGQKMTVVPNTQGTPDRIILKKENGESVISNEYENGTIKMNDKMSGEGQSTFSVKSNSEGAEIFKFLADNGTGKEFGLVTTREHGSTITTNYEDNTVGVTRIASDLSKEGQKIHQIIHNHPGNSMPSGFDVGDTFGDKQSIDYFSSSIGLTWNYVYHSNTNSLIEYNAKDIKRSWSWDAIFPSSKFQLTR